MRRADRSGAAPDGGRARRLVGWASAGGGPFGTGVKGFAAAVLLGVVVLLGVALPRYWVYLVTAVAIGALIARAIGLVTIRTGLIVLCQMSFAAIGGWAVSWGALSWPTAPFPLLVLLGGAVAAPIGLLIGLVTVRIRGVELAVVTLGFAAALDLVLRQDGFPGVGSGTPVLPAAPFDDPRWFFALAWGVLVAAQLAVGAVARTGFGLGWTAVGTSERAAAALGVRVGGAKGTAFGVGALLAGMAGGLLAGQYGLLTTTVFTPLTSMVQLATAVLCGAAVFSGAVLAGVLSVLIPELLRRLGLPLDLGNALLAIGAFDTLRRGEGGLMERLRAAVQDRAFRDAEVSCRFPAPGAQGGPGGAAPPGEPVSPGAERAAPAAPPLLEVTGLTVAYGGARVLDRVELSVGRDEVHALIGPNGAGKSTLVDAVTGFLRRPAGSVRLDGAPIDRLGASERARRGLRRTFQQSRAISELTVDEYLRLAGGAAGSRGGRRAPGPGPRDPAPVRTFFGLPAGRTPVRLMDVGSRRILEVAGALVARPRVLLLDEPAAGLGEAESQALAERVRRVPAEFGVSVLLIEHDMEFVRLSSGRVTVLDEGRVIADGPVAETLADPRVVAAYLGGAGA